MICLIKSMDVRYFYLLNLLKKNYQVIYTDCLSEIIKCEELILPLSGIDSFGYIKKTSLDLNQILDKNDTIKKIYCAKITPKLKKICYKRDIELICFTQDKKYFDSEMDLRLESLLFLLMEKAKRSLKKLHYLYSGNKEVYEKLCNYLKPYTQNVTYDNNNLHNLADYDVIILYNENKINENNADLLNKNVLIFDISDEFNGDFNFLKEMKISYHILGDTGGIFFPITSAENIYNCLKEFL